MSLTLHQLKEPANISPEPGDGPHLRGLKHLYNQDSPDTIMQAMDDLIALLGPNHPRVLKHSHLIDRVTAIQALLVTPESFDPSFIRFQLEQIRHNNHPGLYEKLVHEIVSCITRNIQAALCNRHPRLAHTRYHQAQLLFPTWHHPILLAQINDISLDSHPAEVTTPQIFPTVHDS